MDSLRGTIPAPPRPWHTRPMSDDEDCPALHPTLMVRCILRATDKHVTGTGGGPVHLFSVAWQERTAVPGDGHVYLARRSDPTKRCISCGQGPHEALPDDLDEMGG